MSRIQLWKELHGSNWEMAKHLPNLVLSIYDNGFKMMASQLNNNDIEFYNQSDDVESILFGLLRPVDQ